MSGFESDEYKYYNNIWTLAREESNAGAPLMHDGHPVYKVRQPFITLYLWWEQKTLATGAWVVTDTVGTWNGLAPLWSMFYKKMVCPQDVDRWDGPQENGVVENNFKVEAAPCCSEIVWSGSSAGSFTFTRNDNMINEEYPVYVTGNSTEAIYMWWMWHGGVGHWVTNR